MLLQNVSFLFQLNSDPAKCDTFRINDPDYDMPHQSRGQQGN